MAKSKTTPSGTGVDLGKLFTGALQALSQNQDRLNQLDGTNGDHGDNMVQIFQVAANALSKKKNQPAEKSLAYAAQQVRQLPSGSAQVYANGFENAASTFKGKQIGPQDITTLLSALLSVSPKAGVSQTAPQAQADPFASLLGGLMGGQQAQVGNQQQADPLASLLGGLTGGQQAQEGTEQKVDIASMLLSGGLAFLQAKQSGQDSMTAGVQALLSASPLGQVEHRKESATLVTQGILSVLPQLLGAKK
jgi:hypothetical protein